MEDIAKCGHCTSTQSSFNALIESSLRLRDYKNDPGVEKLSTVLEELEKKTHFDQRKSEERGDIATAINELIRITIAKVDSNNDLKLNILRAGGYFDGTKICCPDEFDFIVDIGALSNYFGNEIKKEMTLDNVDKYDSRLVNVKINEEPSSSVKRFFHPPKNGEESVTGRDIKKDGLPVYILQTQYINEFALKFEEVFSTSDCSVTRPTGTLQTIEGGLVNDYLLGKFIILLWTPTTEESEPLGISVDITPSFRLSSKYTRWNKDYFDIDTYTKLSAIMGKDNCYVRLVLRDEKSWKLSLSHLETELITRLDSIHKKCHRILKMLKEGIPYEVQKGTKIDHSYMVDKKRFSKYTEMCTSFAIKTVVLNHMKGEKHTATLGGCFISMLLEVEEVKIRNGFNAHVTGKQKLLSPSYFLWPQDFAFLTSLNVIIISCLDNQNPNSVVKRILGARQQRILDIYNISTVKKELNCFFNSEEHIDSEHWDYLSSPTVFVGFGLITFCLLDMFV